MPSDLEAAIRRYRQAHQQFYSAPPRDLRTVGDTILLHGLVVSAAELDQLAEQLQADYRRATTRQTGILRRIFDWLNQ
jgi:hypothetical protein